MRGSAVIATTIFGLAMVATILVGLLSGRGRDKSLTEWSVSSRGLGGLSYARPDVRVRVAVAEEAS